MWVGIPQFLINLKRPLTLVRELQRRSWFSPIINQEIMGLSYNGLLLLTCTQRIRFRLPATPQAYFFILVI